VVFYTNMNPRVISSGANVASILKIFTGIVRSGVRYNVNNHVYAVAAVQLGVRTYNKFIQARSRFTGTTGQVVVLTNVHSDSTGHLYLVTIHLARDESGSRQVPITEFMVKRTPVHE